MITLGLIESVLHEHPHFKDDFLYYRFQKQNEHAKRLGITKISKKVRSKDLSPLKTQNALTKKDHKRHILTLFRFSELEEFVLLRQTQSYINSHTILPFIVNTKFETYLDTYFKEESPLITSSPPLLNFDVLDIDDPVEALNQLLPDPLPTTTTLDIPSTVPPDKIFPLRVRTSYRKKLSTGSKTTTSAIVSTPKSTNTRQKRILEKKLKEQKKVKQKESTKLLTHLNGLLEKGKKFKDSPPSIQLHFLPVPPDLPVHDNDK